MTLTCKLIDEPTDDDRAAVWQAMLHDPGADIDSVMAGAALYGIYQQSACIGRLLLRFEGQEAVIVAAVGRLPGVALVGAVWPWLESRLREMGATSVRFHTRRRGLIANMARYGFTAAEVVMRKGLNDGR